MAKLFYSHGKFCASHPWEVMVIFLSLAICIGTMGPFVMIEQQQQHNHNHHNQQHQQQQQQSILDKSMRYYGPQQQQSRCQQQQQQQESTTLFHRHSKKLDDNDSFQFDDCSHNSHHHQSKPTTVEYNSRQQQQQNYHHYHHHHNHNHHSQPSNNVDSTEILILTISRCLALLYVYHQFRNLYNQSKYLVGIAMLFTVFSSIMFMSGVLNFFDGNFAVLNKAIPFFILLSDLSKSCSLARFALSSSNREEIQENIARGMATLGPSLTLDTLVETLAIGMGTISGLPRLAEISYIACLTVIVNYIVFMTFFPATLSLVLELAHDGANKPAWQFSSLAKVLQLETEHTPNPVIQRVKLIMSAGLMMVHMLSRWPLVNDENDGGVLDSFKSSSAVSSASDKLADDEVFNSFTTGLMNAVGTEQILMIGLMFALTIKYFWFENLDIHSRLSSSSSNNIHNSNGSSFATSKDVEELKSSSSYKNSELKEDCSSETSSNLSESCSNTTSTTPSSTRPTTPTTISSTGDESDNSLQHSTNKSNGCSTTNSSTTENSDTESVLGQCRHKLSFSSNGRRTSAKNICVDDQLATSSGHGTDNENESTQQISHDNNNKSDAPAFFIGDDYCNDSSDCYSSDSNVPEYIDSSTQTDTIPNIVADDSLITITDSTACNAAATTTTIDDDTFRDMDELLSILGQEDGYSKLSNREIEFLVANKKVPAYKLESLLNNPERGVSIRRKVIENMANTQGVLTNVPYHGYNYNLVLGACCENVIGYMPIPLGVAGPLLLNGRQYYVPMATTEGCLVASTNRGCSAIAAAGGCRAKVYFDGMTRGPLLYFRSAMDAAAAQEWINRTENFYIIKKAFDSTSRFARLQSIKCSLAGRYLFLRFVASTGDAMGMNMLSKGTELALEELAKHVNGLELKCLSGNFCTDKKPSAVNWIDGRGKSVVCEARIPKNVVQKVLKIDVKKIAHLGNSKNLIGSALAGSIGGNNAQAANIVAAIYIATGQDPAQVVGSANCMTLLEVEDNGDLYISCTMPSIEIGTIGGGTVLGPQGACLELLGLKNKNQAPGENTRELAQIVCATVLAGELSLLSALAAGHLVRSHMKHNRSTINIQASAAAATLETLCPRSSVPSFVGSNGGSGGGGISSSSLSITTPPNSYTLTVPRTGI
ncbi:HMG coenzyme A reductase isoform X2 [Dermatophagoides farinae]